MVPKNGAISMRDSDVIHPEAGPMSTPMAIRRRTLGIFVMRNSRLAKKPINITPPITANAIDTVMGIFS
jgi:hypothetical protein